MSTHHHKSLIQTLKVISSDRDRTNLLRKYEQNLIAYLVQRIPSWISSDMLTFIGFSGSIIIFVGFVLATYIHSSFLLLGVVGFMISWFGDSLDGRVAYYRKKPRKWYGFALDITADWLGIILMGLGFVIYATGFWEFFGFGFVVLYGWEMITTLVRYKITGKYSIDSGLLGPTEVRIVLSLIFILEVVVHNSILYMGVIATAGLFIANLVDSIKLLKLADECDIREKEQPAKNAD
ncbi:MAG: CDP-alcohol phosphatidyltransferase [Paludibacter sp.]|nr:CDP-alcohol phosphatidyltransferase [Paludibacter sp.]